jgi:hypothetical protein
MEQRGKTCRIPESNAGDELNSLLYDKFNEHIMNICS